MSFEQYAKRRKQLLKLINDYIDCVALNGRLEDKSIARIITSLWHRYSKLSNAYTGFGVDLELDS